MFKNYIYTLQKKIHVMRNIKFCVFEINKNNFLRKNANICFLKKIVYQKNVCSLQKGSKNICSITGKYKKVFNSLKINRHEINKWGNRSQLPNYIKSSWQCLNYLKKKI